MAAASRYCWHGLYLRFAIYNPSASAVLANVGLTCTMRLSGGLGGFKADKLIEDRFDFHLAALKWDMQQLRF